MNNFELHFFATKECEQRIFFFFFKKRDYENNPAY